MDKTYLQVKDVNEFFKELHEKCKKKNSYSIVENIQKMGVALEEVKKWVKSNENWAYIIELCQQLCYLHIQDAELAGLLSESEASKYMGDNQSVNHFLCS